MSKECITISNECWVESISLSGGKGYLTYSNPKAASIVLSNGEAIYFWLGGLPGAGISHLQIWINVNGVSNNKGIIGKDIFGLIVFLKDQLPIKKGVTMAGYIDAIGDSGLYDEAELRNSLLNDELYGCSMTVKSVYSGRSCGGLLQLDNWKVKEDYPW